MPPDEACVAEEGAPAADPETGCCPPCSSCPKDCCTAILLLYFFYRASRG